MYILIQKQEEGFEFSARGERGGGRGCASRQPLVPPPLASLICLTCSAVGLWAGSMDSMDSLRPCALSSASSDMVPTGLGPCSDDEPRARDRCPRGEVPDQSAPMEPVPDRETESQGNERCSVPWYGARTWDCRTRPRSCSRCSSGRQGQRKSPRDSQHSFAPSRFCTRAQHSNHWSPHPQPRQGFLLNR